MSYTRHPRTDPDVMILSRSRAMFDRTFWVLFLSIAIFATSIWLAIFEYNYHPRIYRYSEHVTMLEVEDSQLDLNHPERAFTISWQSGRRKVSIWPSQDGPSAQV